MKRAAPLFLCALFAFAACSSDDPTGNGDGDGDGDGDVDAAPEGRIETHSYQFDMNRFAEANVSMKTGETIVVRFTATGGDGYFNIHAHVDGETTYFIEDDYPTLEHTFVPEADETYWLMFGNRGPSTITVDVEVEMFDDVVFNSWGE